MSWRQPRSDYIGRETEKLGRTYLAEEHGRKIYILFYFYCIYKTTFILFLLYILNDFLTNTHFVYDALMFLCSNQLKNSDLLQTMV